MQILRGQTKLAVFSANASLNVRARQASFRSARVTPFDYFSQSPAVVPRTRSTGRKPATRGQNPPDLTAEYPRMLSGDPLRRRQRLRRFVQPLATAVSGTVAGVSCNPFPPHRSPRAAVICKAGLATTEFRKHQGFCCVAAREQKPDNRPHTVPYGFGCTAFQPR